MYLAPLNYDRFFKKVFSHTHIAKAFLEDFLEVTIEEIELLPTSHFLTDDAAKLAFDFRCKINGADIIIDMQQWYKPDVIKRFYLYHCTSTALQLERLPEKKLPTSIADKRAKTHDYRIVSPVLTLIWMVNDNFRFEENYMAYSIAPEIAITFLQNETLWQSDSMREIIETRNAILKTLSKKDKELDFLPQNRLIFMFQSNIIKNLDKAKYAKWFDFAEKTLNKENEEADFSDYKREDIFSEIMVLINQKGLDKSDFDYIETEDEHIEMVNRYIDGVREDAKKEGWEEGLEEGIEQGREEGREEGIEQGREQTEEKLVTNPYKKGKTPEEIAEFLEISLERVLAIIQKAKDADRL